jgi:ATP-dependent helicase/nuclease subunit B
VGPVAAAKELRRAAIGWGRDRHLPALDRLAAEIAFPRPLRAEDDEDPAARKARRDKRLAALGAARTFVSRALSLAPESVSSDLATLSRGARTFVAEFARVRDELDGTASAALSKLFIELESLPGRAAPLADAAARLTDAVLALHVTPERPRPGRIHFADFRAGGFSGRPVTFLIGLDERRHPGGDREDPVLSDHERARINELSASSAPLSLSPDRSRENAAALRACVARLRGDVSFGYAGWNLRDLANPGEVFPSPFLLEVFRLRPGEAAADYARFSTLAGEGEGFVPGVDRALDETEWWLSRIGDRRGDDTSSAVARLHPWLRDGLRAEEARESTEPTAWDGVFSSPAPELDPRVNGRPMSASRIQALAECPFGYFLAHVLKLSSPDEPEDNGSEWLDARSSGSLIHRVFRRFLEGLSKAGRRPSYPGDLDEIAAEAGAELQEMRKRIPPRSELAFSRRRDDVLFACRTFLISEAARCEDVEPVAFEVAFGISAEDRPSEFPDPVEIPLGGGRTLKLRGSIDRVDRDASGAFHVWDYKTGTASYTHEQLGIAAGRQIQPALYALAWQSLRARRGESARIAESGYFFPGRRGLGERFTIPFSEPETRETLNALFDLLAAGAFPHSPEEDSDCFTCRELVGFCSDRKESGRRSQGKLAHSALPALAGWRRLRER